jgi:DNA topoisomerase-1
MPLAKRKKGKVLRGPDPLRRDPSRTRLLRESLVKQLDKRFGLLKRDVVDFVAKGDAFGLAVNQFCATGEGGGVDPSCDADASSGVLGRLKSIGAAAGELEHSAKSWVTDKIGVAVSKLPGPMQRAVTATYHVVRAGTKAAFVTWTAGQAFAERVARERGATDEEARRLRGVLSALDVTSFKPISIAASASGVGAGALLGVSFVPPASAAYLAYSTARDPAATYRAAKSAVASVFSVTGRTQFALNSADDIVTALERHEYDDWYVALLMASIEATGDISLALTTAERAADLVATNARELSHFRSDPDKIKGFQKWLKTRVDVRIKKGEEGKLWEAFVRQGFERGAGRSFDEVKSRAKGAMKEDVAGYAGKREQFLKDSFARPTTVEKVKAIASRAYEDMGGVTSDMADRMRQTLAEGLTQGKNPREIARDLTDDVDISAARARTIARTEVVRAHAEGQLDSLEAMGVTEVGVMVEWKTSGLDEVDKRGNPVSPCELCIPMEGVVLKIEEARGMIPRHPNCKCAWIPGNVGEDDEDQKRGAAAIRKAIGKSAGDDDEWGDVEIDSSRPTRNRFTVIDLNEDFDEHLHKLYDGIDDNAFCPGEGARDNSCGSGKGGGLKDPVYEKLAKVLGEPDEVSRGSDGGTNVRWKVAKELGEKVKALGLPRQDSKTDMSGVEVYGSGTVHMWTPENRSGTATKAQDEKLGEHFVKLHNDASKEFKAAFKEIGAKMWNSDDAHKIDSARSFEGATRDEVAKASPITYPLTVMDSYPEARVHTARLEKNLDKIQSKYEKQWKSMVSDVFDSTENAFCPTGEGGGQDNSCSTSKSGDKSAKGKKGKSSPQEEPPVQWVGPLENIPSKDLDRAFVKDGKVWMRQSAPTATSRSDAEPAVAKLVNDWKKESYADMPLPTLFERLKTEKDVSVEEFHATVKKLHDDSVIRLSGWAGPLSDMPQPEASTIVGHKVMHYARPGPVALNAFCATGEGGGQDNSCSPTKSTSRGEKLRLAVRGEDKQWRGVDGKLMPEHIQKLGIPPAWKNVYANPDSKGTLLATGTDAKGRTQYKYSDSHSAKQAAAKFGRVRELIQMRGEVLKELDRDAKDSELRDRADALRVVMQTGMRPGSDHDTKADHKSYGATTLEGRHVSVDGKTLTLVTGKNKGREVEFPVRDPKTQKMLVERAKSAGKDGRLFETSAGDLRSYSKDKDGGGFKTKDHRTALGTETAVLKIRELPTPVTPREYKAAVREVATVVSKTLGNTASVALKSYIDPQVFAHWRKESGS